MRDPYSVLGVDKRADEKAIKSAFRKLAKKYHPDQHPDDKSAQNRFAEIGQAYEILGDKEKRARFDRGEIDAEGKERAFADPFGGRGGFSGFGRGGFANDGSGSPFGGARRARGGSTAEDILSELFGRGGMGGGMGGGAGGGMGGSAAGGSPFGRAGGDPFAGAAQRTRRGADVEVELPVTIEEAIEADRATATLPDGRRLAVKLPQGVRDGQTIRLKGQGEAGPGGGPKGDARVTVRLKPHPLYRVDGDHLHVALEVPLEDAVLGAKLPVQTPSGRVAVTVPPMTGSDRTFRLKGRGLPKDENGARGDLMVDVRVMLGEDPDGRLAALMRERREAQGE